MKKFNFKNPRTLIILVSAFIVVVLILGLIFGICTKYNKNNTKEAETEYVSKESETKKNDSEKSLVNNIESSTEQTTEEITTENDSKENTTEEASTEEIIASDNEIINSNNENNYNDNSYNENNYSDNSSSNNEDQNNNDDSNSSNNENDNSSNSEPSYNPPSNEPSNDTPQEDHIVYKSDGSIDLNESYWVNRRDADSIIYNSKEMNDFKNYINKKYNCNGGYVTHMNYSGRHNTWSVYDFTYHLKCGSQVIHFYFNGSEFVEK